MLLCAILVGDILRNTLCSALTHLIISPDAAL